METEIRKEYQNLPKDQHNSLKSTEDRQIETYYIYIKLHFTWSKQWPYISPSFINTNPSIIGFIDSSPLKKKKQISEEEMVIVHGKHEESWILSQSSDMERDNSRFLREPAISSAIHKHVKIQPLRANHTVFVRCIAISKGIAISTFSFASSICLDEEWREERNMNVYSTRDTCGDLQTNNTSPYLSPRLFLAS